ncbi:NMA1 [Symbiodinium sp. KB8]|nr:NMA1 [Symbiodinium sp. KB8]
MNLTYCLLRIRDRPNAVLAIDEATFAVIQRPVLAPLEAFRTAVVDTLPVRRHYDMRRRHSRDVEIVFILRADDSVEDLNADQHRLLLWTKKDFARERESLHGTLRGKRPDSGSASGSGRSPRMLTRMEVFQMRKELVALRSHDTAGGSKACKELEAVRKAYSDMAKAMQPVTENARAGEAVSDVEEATLPFLLSRQALAEDKAVALLRAGELVEVPGQIFQQGDPACNGVTVQILMPDLGPDVIPAWVPVETLYDGQVFGDAKVAAWRDAQEGPPRRKAGAHAQEDSCLLRICAGDYREAMGLLDGKDAANPRPESQKETLEQDDQAAALLPDVRLKVHALASSPLFEGANINNLALLASNVEEIVLRYDDVFLEIGQALQACFLISGGYVRVSVPVIDQDACMGSLEDASRILGMGRLPGSLDGSAQSGWSETPRSRPGCGSPRKAKQDNLPSRFRLKSSGELPVFQLGDRPLLLPPTQSVSVASGTKKGSRLTPRRPGTPRRGTPWQEALRQKRMAPFIGVAPSELELCNLHVGECFGLAALYDPKGECPYPSKCEVRVQSSEARIMVLTNGSLLYLNETLARTLVDRAKQKGDPVAPALQDIKQERTHRSRWTMQKLKVLDRIVMHE